MFYALLIEKCAKNDSWSLQYHHNSRKDTLCYKIIKVYLSHIIGWICKSWILIGGVDLLYVPFFFFGRTTACGGSQAGDWTRTAAVPTPDPYPAKPQENSFMNIFYTEHTLFVSGGGALTGAKWHGRPQQRVATLRMAPVRTRAVGPVGVRQQEMFPFYLLSVDQLTPWSIDLISFGFDLEAFLL